MSTSNKFSFSAHALKILKFFLHDFILNNFFQLIYKPLLHIYKIVDVAAILVSRFSVLKQFYSERGKKEGIIHKQKRGACPSNGRTVHFVDEPHFFPSLGAECFNTEKRLTKIAATSTIL